MSAAAGGAHEQHASAWQVLAEVTTAGLSPERRQEAQAAVMAVMWPEPETPCDFRNVT